MSITTLRIKCYSVIPYRQLLRPFLNEIKYGRTIELKKCLDSLILENSFKTFLGNMPIFIPCPRSSPRKKDAVWPSQSIVTELLGRVDDSSIEEVIERATAVPKSAFCISNERPTISIHFASLNVEARTTIPQNANLIIVDDFITKGATTAACYKQLKQIYPGATVKVLSLFRSNYNSITTPDCKYHPCNGEINIDDSGLSVVIHQE